MLSSLSNLYTVCRLHERAPQSDSVLCSQYANIGVLPTGDVIRHMPAHSHFPFCPAPGEVPVFGRHTCTMTVEQVGGSPGKNQADRCSILYAYFFLK